MQINSVIPSQITAPVTTAESGSGSARIESGKSFAHTMSQLLHEADQPQKEMMQGMQRLIAGETENVHELAISVAKADVAFRLVMEVRDKLISAYQEVMRMQV
jgi:flagellar hook-basal body complex protein FliE